MIKNKINPITAELKEFIEHLLIRNFPGRTGKIIRKLYWSRQFRESSDSIYISFGCIIKGPENIYIKENVSIMHNCCLEADSNGILKVGDRVRINSNVILGASDNGEIIIGNDVLIGPNVVIRASNHRYKKKNIPINLQGHTCGKILIEDDVWIGATSVILPNVRIGKGSVIAAGAVVNKNIPEYVLAGGVPARVIKENIRT